MSDFFEPPPDPDDNPAPGTLGDAPAPAEEIAELRAILDQQQTVLVAIDEALAKIIDARTGKIARAPWCYHDPPQPGEGEDELTVWVSWWNASYAPLQTKNQIPPCWGLHGGLAAEIATLYHTWRRAFHDAKATAEAAQTWHDRWLPGFLHRMELWCSDECRRGQHREPVSARRHTD